MIMKMIDFTKRCPVQISCVRNVSGYGGPLIFRAFKDPFVEMMKYIYVDLHILLWQNALNVFLFRRPKTQFAFLPVLTSKAPNAAYNQLSPMTPISF